MITVLYYQINTLMMKILSILKNLEVVKDKQRLGAVSGDVVGEELHATKHGESPVLQFPVSHLVVGFRTQVTAVEGTNGLVGDLLPHHLLKEPNKSKQLHPAKHRHVEEGRYAIVDIGELEIVDGGNESTQTEVVLGEVSHHSELCHTAVLELGGSILIELLLCDALGQTQRIPVASGLKHAKFVSIIHLQSTRPCNPTHRRKC